MTTIKLQQWPIPLTTARGTILDAALAAGVPYPHSCRSGDCGSCKSRLFCGEVTMDGCAPEALTATERAAGLILACRARPLTDVEVAWLSAATAARSYPLRRVRATVIAKEAVTHDITRLRLAVTGAPLAFVAGQFAQLTFRGRPPRPYSMANQPGEAALEFHIRRVPEGVVSSYVADEVQRGDTLELQGPYGTACLRDPDVRPLLLVAGGSGLAPMKSILLAALALPQPRPIYLYHGVRDLCDLYEVELLTTLAQAPPVRYTPVLSRPAQATRYRTGYVHEAIAADFTTLEGCAVYLAGPPPMVHAATAVALGLGAPREAVYADPFSAAPEEPQRSTSLLSVLAYLGASVSQAIRQPRRRLLS
jgi:CDP-4-dehydro-6-deoxyglucose reductase/ferredoxin-NAD(P)+ reductase (naphthalene dioxygenase ferredoxin-specific)